MQHRYNNSQYRPCRLTHFAIPHRIFPGGYLSRWNEDSFGSLPERIGKIVRFFGWRTRCWYRVSTFAEKYHQRPPLEDSCLFYLGTFLDGRIGDDTACPRWTISKTESAVGIDFIPQRLFKHKLSRCVARLFWSHVGSLYI